MGRRKDETEAAIPHILLCAVGYQGRAAAWGRMSKSVKDGVKPFNLPFSDQLKVRLFQSWAEKPHSGPFSKTCYGSAGFGTQELVPVVAEPRPARFSWSHRFFFC